MPNWLMFTTQQQCFQGIDSGGHNKQQFYAFYVQQQLKHAQINLLTIVIFRSIQRGNHKQIYYQMMPFLFILFIAAITHSAAVPNPPCIVCHNAVKVFQKIAPIQPFLGIAEKIALKQCLKQGQYDYQVCKDTIATMTPFIVKSAWKRYTDPHMICSELKMCRQQYEKRNLEEEINKIIEGKPNKKWESPTRRRIMRIMHVSDIHPDLYYAVGSVANCPQPVCCRADVKPKFQQILQKINNGQVLQIRAPQIVETRKTPQQPEKRFQTPQQSEKSFQTSQQSEKSLQKLEKTSQTPQIQQNPLQSVKVKSQKSPQKSQQNTAGYWGTIASCQLPFQTFQLFLKNLRNMSLDLIIWTGDNTPHDIWKQTQDYNLNYTRLLADKFKNATDTPVIATMGNHESWPVNVYDFGSDREDVLIGGLANSWRQWLDEKAYEMLRTKGYYAITIPKMNNLRIISLNTQAGNDKNWFLLQNPTDPGEMLVWLQKQLSQAENQGYLVWIIGHVHPKSTLNEWVMRYNALIDRYSYVIRSQFFGHSHTDHIAFYPSFKNKGTLSGFYMISPSLTTATFKNPEYRILEVDYDTLQILDYKQYMLNLSSNPKKQDNPQFELFYSFKEAYDLEDMELEKGITELYHKLETNEKYQIKYTYFMECGLKKGRAGRDVFCDTTTSPQFHAECMQKQYTPDWFVKVAGPWKNLRHKQ